MCSTTGWSSFIPNYDTRLIMANIRHLIRGEELEQMFPSYSGFTGGIVPDGKGKFGVSGKIERINDTTLLITELPIRKWTQDYKMFLEGMLVASSKGANPDIKDFKENHTDTTVSFTIIAEKENIDHWETLPKGGLYAKFKLSTSLSTLNMNLFDTENRIIKYATPEDILKEFYKLRLEYYVKRKELLVKKLQEEQRMLSNKARFVEEVCSGSLIVSNRKKVELLHDLQERGYELFDKSTKKNDAEPSEEEENDDDTSSVGTLAKGYEYLLGMKIWSLTFEKAEELRRQLAMRTAELEELQGTAPCQIWLNDLDAIDAALDDRDVEIADAERDEQEAQQKNKRRQTAKQKKGAAAKRGGKKKLVTCDPDISDGDTDSEMEVIKKSASSSRRKVTQAATKKASSAKVAPAAATTKPTPSEVLPPVLPKQEVEDDFEMSLAERMKKKMMISPPALKVGRGGVAAGESAKQTLFLDDDSSSSGSGSRGTKRPSPKASEDDDFDNDDFDDDSTPRSVDEPKRGRGRPKRARATTSTAATKTVAKKTVATKATTRKAPAKKTTAKTGRGARRKVVDDESDSDDSFGFGSDVEEEPQKKTTARAASTRTRAARTATTKKATSYVFSSDSEDDF